MATEREFFVKLGSILWYLGRAAVTFALACFAGHNKSWSAA